MPSVVHRWDSTVVREFVRNKRWGCEEDGGCDECGREGGEGVRERW